MPSCKTGHIYIVFTALTKPPKEKYALCISEPNEWFVWFNTLARSHGRDQFQVASGVHELIVHDSFLDLSRVVFHSAAEIEAGKEFACISKSFRDEIVAFVTAGLEVMPERQSQIVLANLTALTFD